MELVLCFYHFISKLYAGLCSATVGELTACYSGKRAKKKKYIVKKIYNVCIKKILFAAKFIVN